MQRLVIFALLSALLLSVQQDSASADETTGTWSGEIEARGNYYWERSTRVVAPEIGAVITSPTGLRARAHYLVDSITSASVAAGTQVDVGFTEIRHDVSIGAGGVFEVGDNTLDVEISGRLSSEPDYFSKAVTLSGSLLFNDKNTSIGSSVTFLHDDVQSVSRGAGGVEGLVDDQGNVGTLTSIATSLNASHNLSPNLVLSGGYDYTHLRGYLANPYRSVSLGAAPLPESHPDRRNRHTLHTRLAWYLPGTQTAIHGLLRGYADSWDIMAINPEIRVYQEVANTLTARVRYRYYGQSKAFFQSAQYTPDDEFYTADGKMEAFQTHLMGAKVIVPLSFMRGSGLGFMERATFDLSFDIALSNSFFGDYVIAQSGLRVPFE